MIEEQPYNRRETVCRCWCSKNKRQFGLVLSSPKPDVWEVKHPYSVTEGYKENEKESEVISGTISLSIDYSGCKWCSNREIFQCGECQALNCQGSKKRNEVKCAICNARLKLQGVITSLDVTKD